MKVISLLLAISYITLIHGSVVFEPVNFCKFYNAEPECNPNAKYRSINGFCNNLNHPKWGAELNTYQRLFGTRYQDNVFQVIKSVTGDDLPNPRKLSLYLFSNRNITSDKFSLMLPQFGQYIAEDKGMTADIFLPKSCCSEDGQLSTDPLDPMCLYIPIDSDDPTYEEQPRECMNFVRVTTDVSANCPGFNSYGGPANQINAVTAFLDHSGVYGNNDDDLQKLRSYSDGLLATQIVHGVEYAPRAPSLCDEATEEKKCYLGGDFRMNQLPSLATIHTIFIREHNRLARELKLLNPHWNDEKLFQEARRINIAIFQHITYYHYFPEIVGKNILKQKNILYHDEGGRRVNDYDKNVNPAISHEHANAANRFFHVMTRGDYDLISRHDEYLGTSLIKDSYFHPGFIQSGSFMDDISRGMCRSAAIEPGKNMVDAFKESVFRRVAKFTQDLKAVDIQRGRDVGLVSYNDAREYCGLPRATSFSCFADEIPEHDIHKLRRIYAHPDDVELSVGAALERIIDGTAAGKTFSCIIVNQLYISRIGDRFWYETNDPLLRFTRHQLKEIRKSSLARVYCDNGKHIDRMQRNVFRLPSDDNPIVECNHIPKMNLQYWRE